MKYEENHIVCLVQKPNKFYNSNIFNRTGMKNILRVLWGEFIYSGHLLALGLVGTAALTATIVKINLTWDFVVVVYAPTLAACLFGRYLNLKEDALTNPVRYKHLGGRTKKIPLTILLLVLLMTAIILNYHKYVVLLFALGLISLSVLYELLFKRFTKIFIGFKNFFSALVFTLVSVLLLLYYDLPPTLPLYLILIFIYVMSFCATSHSDLKDVADDKQKGLKTFAVTLGGHNLMTMLSWLNILVALFVIICVKLKIFPYYALGLLFAVIYNLLLFKVSRRKDINMDTIIDVYSDAQFILWWIFVIISKVVFS